MTSYEQGFLTKCAEHGVDGVALLRSMRKAAEPNDDNVAWLAKMWNQARVNRQKAVDLLRRNGMPGKPGDGAYEQWVKSPIGSIAEEANANRSGFADLGPGLNKEWFGKAPADIVSALNALNAEYESPERYASMTGEGTGPDPRFSIDETKANPGPKTEAGPARRKRGWRSTTGH